MRMDAGTRRESVFGNASVEQVDRFVSLGEKTPRFTISDKTLYLLSVLSQQLGKFMLKEPKWGRDPGGVDAAYQLAMEEGEDRMFSVSFLVDIYNVLGREIGRMPFSLEAADIPEETQNCLYQVEELFGWAEQTRLHPILAGCVVHYELAEVYPFREEGERIGGIWNNLLLARWDPVFWRFPLAQVLSGKEEDCRKAFRKSKEEADAGTAVDFLLLALMERLAHVRW